MISSILRTFGSFGKLTRSTVLRRNILSEAYRCDSAWNERLHDPAFKKVIPSDLGMMISQKLDNGESVSPIDIDVYANVIHRLDVTSLWFAEEILKRFRKTQQSLHSLESTSHAIVRGFLELEEYDRIINIIRKKSEYGIFLDDVSAILVMNKCLERGDPAMAVEVAYELMLQEEDFKKYPLLTAMCLRSCQLHWKTVQETGGWPPMEAPAEEVDEDDIEYVVVKYVRNDNYDDHFDLTEDRLLLGKTFISLHEALTDQPAIKNSCLLLGLAMYEKFDRLGEETQRVIDENLPVAQNTMDDIIFLIQSTSTLPEGEENGPKKRHFISAAEKESIILRFKDILPKISTVNESFHIQCSNFFNFVINDTEADEIQRVQQLYKDFKEVRDKKIESEMNESKKNTLHLTAKRKLRELLDKEELLLSYENRADIDYAAWLAPRSRAEKRRSRREEWQKDIDNIPKTTARTFLDKE